MVKDRRKVLKHAATIDPTALMHHASQHHEPESIGEMLNHYDDIHRVIENPLAHKKTMGKDLDVSGEVHIRAVVESHSHVFPESVYNHHFQLPGVYIIETGRCSIINIDAQGNRRNISVIGRNDSFGGSERIKIATLDYLGEIVAGCDIQSGPAAAAERTVSCHYLTPEDMRRIPEFELKNFSEVIHESNMPFM